MSPQVPSTSKKVPKTRMKFDRTNYEKILEGYRGAPGNHSAASRWSGVDRQAATRAWTKGWPQFAWARPIRDVLKEEGDAKRIADLEKARRAREADDADRAKNEGERKQAIDEERQVMRTVREDVLHAANVVKRLVPSMHVLGMIIQNELIDPTTGKAFPNPAIKAPQAMKLLRDFSTLVARVSIAERVVVELGRLDRGESTANVKEVTDMDNDALLESLDLIASVRDQVRADLASGAMDEEPEPGPAGAPPTTH